MINYLQQNKTCNGTRDALEELYGVIVEPDYIYAMVDYKPNKKDTKVRRVERLDIGSNPLLAYSLYGLSIELI